MVPEDGVGAGADEWAVVRHDGSAEEITMRLESKEALERAALIMPLPAPAEFSLGDDAIFDELAERTKPRHERKKRYVLFGSGGGLGGSDDGAAGPGGVEVVGEQDLGPLRIVTLRGDDASAVGRYLDAQGFATPEGLEPIAQEYLDDGWVIAAARLRTESGEPLQSLQPLVMRFRSAEVVYPLKMSELASSYVKARVDVIAPHPVALAEDTRWKKRDIEEPSRSGTGRIFGGPMSGGRYLSSFQFGIVGGEKGDAEFVRAERDDLRQVIYDYDNVQIGGWILLGIFVLGLLGVGLVVVLIARGRVRKTSGP